MANSFINYIKELVSSSLTPDNKKYSDALKELEGSLDVGKRETVEKTVLPDAPSYERLEFESLTDEQIAKQAEDALVDYLNSGKSAIIAESEAMAKKLNDDKSYAKSSAKAKESSIESAYGEAKEATSNDVLKRGLARSSIAVNKQSELDSAKAAGISKVYSDFNDAIQSLDSQISELAVKREKALNDFDITYAAKLTSTINDLRKELDDKQTEAIKYNNSLSEKEASYNVNKIVTESELYGKDLNNYEKQKELSENYLIDYEGNYNKMASYLRTLSKTEARELILNNGMFKGNLDATHYYKLYDEFCR